MLVERKRHKAGEYYTPEWLVQLIDVFVLWEEKKGGYSKNFRLMKNREYQNFLKKEVLNYHLLENKDVPLFTQMELVTLFFVLG